MGRLDGRVAIVTGGAAGMGAATCRLFAKEGCKVGIGDRNGDLGQQVEAEINEAGGEAVYLTLDVTSEDSWQGAVDAMVSKYGKLDILVNFAGISSTIYKDDFDGDAWDQYMLINAKGPFLGTKYCVPKLREQGGGSIVNVSSINGLVGTAHGHPGYNASKAALRLYTKAMAARLGVDNIRVNSIHPGRMPPMSTGDPGPYWERNEEAMKTIPLRRAGTREEAANVALFLASDDSSYITGAELVVDGGWTAV